MFTTCAHYVNIPPLETSYSQFRFAPLRITWRGDLRRYTPFRYAELRITADIQNLFPQILQDVLQ